ncbi:unnamed protein product, partial [marine sediment metagenome]
MKTKKLKAELRKKREKPVINRDDWVSTGSVLLNLACSGRSYGGFAKGHYYFVVGDTASGKTFLSLTCLAEASINPNFDDYRFIYDNGEDGALMNIARFFGQRVADRMEPPAMENGEPVFSRLAEDMYFHLDDAVEDGRPFIYIQDSMDVLDSEQA